MSIAHMAFSVGMLLGIACAVGALWLFGSSGAVVMLGIAAILLLNLLIWLLRVGLRARKGR